MQELQFMATRHVQYMYEYELRRVHLLLIVDGQISDFGGIRKIVDHPIQQRLHTFVLQGRSHEHGRERTGDDRTTNRRLTHKPEQHRIMAKNETNRK